ncbi:hypothetical protein [Pedobacter zeae]|uniref:Uncharacterized protein n=1 Tax=Pedobacter zeae TaxID=1737356 RepID=A0A7W6KBM7_9SPHI|nr:hypothetical protein [Pedobacter zeae]MBB4107705.1 hypothetical protein [Pedobacter zeae]GGG97608.1 hypothetical protein GCM10007422_09470 [Pedobacter zeae]
MNTLTVDTGVQVAITRRITSVMLKSHGGVDVRFEKTISIPDEREDITEDEREDIEIHSDDKSDVKSLPHPDLLHAMEILRAHYAILANQLGGREADLPALDDDVDFLMLFKLEGVKINYDSSSATCSMKGTSSTQFGTLKIETAPISFDGNYQWKDEFSHAVMHLCDEALRYLDGKIAPSNQLDMFDQADANELD